MCLVLFAYRMHPDYELILAANRDEFYTRPSAPLDIWPDAPEVLAGRDLKAGGTWLGNATDGSLALLTNFRESGIHNPNAPSRGLLNQSFLTGGDNAPQYLKRLAPQAHQYNGFNLLLRDSTGLWYFSNRDKAGHRTLEPGFYGLSNHLLDTPWPKVSRGKKGLAALLEQSTPPRLDDLLSLLEDRWQPEPETLPATGLNHEREQLLAPIFITSSDYGTRSSTAMILSSNEDLIIAEKIHQEGTVRQFHRSGSKYHGVSFCHHN